MRHSSVTSTSPTALCVFLERVLKVCGAPLQRSTGTLFHGVFARGPGAGSPLPQDSGSGSAIRIGICSGGKANVGNRQRQLDIIFQVEGQPGCKDAYLHCPPLALPPYRDFRLVRGWTGLVLDFPRTRAAVVCLRCCLSQMCQRRTRVDAHLRCLSHYDQMHPRCKYFSLSLSIYIYIYISLSITPSHMWTTSSVGARHNHILLKSLKLKPHAPGIRVQRPGLDSGPGLRSGAATVTLKRPGVLYSALGAGPILPAARSPAGGHLPARRREGACSGLRARTGPAPFGAGCRQGLARLLVWAGRVLPQGPRGVRGLLLALPTRPSTSTRYVCPCHGPQPPGLHRQTWNSVYTLFTFGGVRRDHYDSRGAYSAF